MSGSQSESISISGVSTSPLHTVPNTTPTRTTPTPPHTTPVPTRRPTQTSPTHTSFTRRPTITSPTHISSTRGPTHASPTHASPIRTPTVLVRRDSESRRVRKGLSLSSKPPPPASCVFDHVSPVHKSIGHRLSMVHGEREDSETPEALEAGAGAKRKTTVHKTGIEFSPTPDSFTKHDWARYPQMDEDPALPRVVRKQRKRLMTMAQENMELVNNPYDEPQEPLNPPPSRPPSGYVPRMEETPMQAAKETANEAAKQAAMQAAIRQVAKKAAKKAAMVAAMQAAKNGIDPANYPHMAQLLADRYASPKPPDSRPPSRSPSAVMTQGPPRPERIPGTPVGSSLGPLNMMYRPSRHKIDAATMYDPYPKRQIKRPLAADEQAVLFNYHQVNYNIRVKSACNSE